MAAKAAHENQPLYYAKPGFGPRVDWNRFPMSAWYLYGPHFAVAISPMAKLSFVGFCRVWYVLLFVTFWLYAACLCRLATSRVSLSGTVIAGLVLGMTPGSGDAMSFGNVDPMLYALFGLSLVTSYRGIPLALAMLVKPYPAYFLALASYREGRKVYVPALVVIITALAFGAVGCGIHAYVDWVRYSLSPLSQGMLERGNISLSFAILRLACLLGWRCPIGPLPLLPHAYLIITGITAPIIAVWATRRSEKLTQYAVVTIAAILFSPYCLLSYFPLLLVVGSLRWRTMLNRMTS